MSDQQAILDQADAKQRVLDVLKAHAPEAVTTWALIHEAGTSAAARRCWDLKNEGYDIEKVHVRGSTYAWRYRGPRQGRLFGRVA